MKKTLLLPESLPHAQASGHSGSHGEAKQLSPDREAFASARRRLLDAARTPAPDVVYGYGNTEEHGFDEDAVEKMRGRFGLNRISRPAGDAVLKRLAAAFINPFTVVLFVLACISFVADFVLAAPEDRDIKTVAIIASMVFISGALRFVQEYRSDKAAERLKA
ncbi:MAG: hypothetical protein LBC79_02420, partial [Deltaproteobacteria bacterium]|nr:hypothetical protein [Deltaproteobacteria bacterium]